MLQIKLIGSKKETLGNLLIALLFVLPYLERGPLSFPITNLQRTFYWRSVLTFQVILFLVLSFAHFKAKIKRRYNLSVFILFMYLLFNGGLSIALGADVVASIVVLLSIIAPIYNALYLTTTIKKKNLSVESVIRWAVNLYTAFVLFCIGFNIIKYGLTLSISANKYRLSASAGGTVILGYTISLVTVFMFANKDLFSKRNLIISSIVFVLGIIYTMDRGAYIVLLIGLAYLVITEKNRILQWLLIAGIILGIILFSDDIYTRVLGLLLGNRVYSLDITKSDRFSTLASCLEVFLREKTYYLFGHGVSNFFPFQQWTAKYAGADESIYGIVGINEFFYNGYNLLVQPHNTFIYLLLETGFVGVALILRVVLFGVVNRFRKISSNVLVVVISFLFLWMLESTVIIQPGIACMWWLIITLTKYRFGTLDNCVTNYIWER